MMNVYSTFKNWRFDNIQYSFPMRVPLSYATTPPPTPGATDSTRQFLMLLGLGT